MDQKQISNPVQFHGKGGEFFGIWIVNVLLSIITLGIYSAWAKVRTKRYFYGNTQIASDNFEYHATPIQILKGRIVAFVLIVIWTIGLSVHPAISSLFILIFYAALPWLIWSNARFDCAMTSYRNVHFSFVGSLGGAYKSLMGRGFVALLAIGAYFALVGFAAQFSQPLVVVLVIGSIFVMAAVQAWVLAGMHGYFINGYRYGDWQFSGDVEVGFFIKLAFKAAGLFLAAVIGLGLIIALLVGGLASFEALTNPYMVMAVIMGAAASYVLLLIVVGLLGAAMFAYMAVQTRNYLFSRVVIAKEAQENRFGLTSSMSTSGYVGLVVTNFLILIFTLGLGRAWVMVRTSHYVAEHTSVEGDMDLLLAADQDSDVKSAIGDEVAQAFDVNLGIG
ncbi:YjgN family protein [Vibrio japonicus]|uniref:YjgN family protein n=1 Tax=Vibrio japonicus TaxID=1824638 RepID=A0ABY5LIL5_9VIBR|nr:YjgN family protein [Vibrio japonicus]UUM30942.1 YjgN family protein [Vibrio japonicus]